VGGSSRKYAIVKPHVSSIWLVQHGVNLTQKEVLSLEQVGFLFDLGRCTSPRNLFKGEPSTSSNFQVPSACRLDVIKPIDVSNWPTSRCGKKVRRPTMFKSMQ
jgi:hypothetical protein